MFNTSPNLKWLSYYSSTSLYPVIKYPQPILKEAVNLYKTIP